MSQLHFRFAARTSAGIARTDVQPAIPAAPKRRRPTLAFGGMSMAFVIMLLSATGCAKNNKSTLQEEAAAVEVAAETESAAMAEIDASRSVPAAPLTPAQRDGVISTVDDGAVRAERLIPALQSNEAAAIHGVWSLDEAKTLELLPVEAREATAEILGQVQPAMAFSARGVAHQSFIASTGERFQQVANYRVKEEGEGRYLLEFTAIFDEDGKVMDSQGQIFARVQVQADGSLLYEPFVVVHGQLEGDSALVLKRASEADIQRHQLTEG